MEKDKNIFLVFTGSAHIPSIFLSNTRFNGFSIHPAYIHAIMQAYFLLMRTLLVHSILHWLPVHQVATPRITIYISKSTNSTSNLALMIMPDRTFQFCANLRTNTSTKQILEQIGKQPFFAKIAVEISNKTAMLA